MDRDLRRRERRVLQSPHEAGSLKQLARQYRRSGQWLRAYKIYSSLNLIDSDELEIRSLVADMVKTQSLALIDHPKHWMAFPSWAFLHAYTVQIDFIQDQGRVLEGVEIPGPIDRHDFRAIVAIPYISALRLRESHWFSADLSVLREAKDLESLSIAFINAKHAPLKGLESLQGLKNLDLACRNLNPELLRAISSLKTLQTLSLKVTRGSLQSLASLNNPSLSHISIESKYFEGKDCDFLSELTTLKELSIEGDLKQLELERLSQSKSLENLTLSRIGQKTAIPDYSALGELKQLKELSLFLCGISSEQCHFFSEFQDLEQLTITKNSDIKSAIYPHIAKLRSLKGLDLFRTAVGDEGLAELQTLESLQYLFLSSTHVTENGLKSLRQLSNLRELFHDNNYSSEDGSLAALFEELNE